VYLFFPGLTLLALAFSVHVLLWRVFVPRRQFMALLLIFAFVPAAIIAAAAATGIPPAFRVAAPDMFRLALFYVSCSLVYICLYSAIEIPSPTLTIVSVIADHGADGRSEQEIASALMQNDDVGLRIGAMVRSGLITVDRGFCRLTGKGRLLAGLFELASVVFGLPPGG
jgi:hypothetical protein